MKTRLDLLISDVRKLASAENYSGTHGLSSHFFMVSANNASLSLQRYLVQNVAEVFTAYQEDDIVAAQESYDPPDRIFARHMIHECAFSSNGDAQNYHDMQLSYVREAAAAGDPEEYFVDGAKTYIYPQPAATGGTIRRRYTQLVDEIGFIRGQVTSAAGAAPNFTSITLDNDDWLDDGALDENDEGLLDYEYICVVDEEGAMQTRNVRIASYDATTRVLTIASGWAAADGETIGAGTFVVIGPNTSSHLYSWDPCVRDFFVRFMVLEAHQRRSSTDTMEAHPQLQAIASSIAEVYGMKPFGKAPIPEARGDW